MINLSQLIQMSYDPRFHNIPSNMLPHGDIMFSITHDWYIKMQTIFLQGNPGPIDPMTIADLMIPLKYISDLPKRIFNNEQHIVQDVPD